MDSHPHRVTVLAATIAFCVALAVDILQIVLDLVGGFFGGPTGGFTVAVATFINWIIDAIGERAIYVWFRSRGVNIFGEHTRLVTVTIFIAKFIPYFGQLAFFSLDIIAIVSLSRFDEAVDSLTGETITTTPSSDVIRVSRAEQQSRRPDFTPKRSSTQKAV